MIFLLAERLVDVEESLPGRLDRAGELRDRGRWNRVLGVRR
jgi:hypothetical protein